MEIRDTHHVALKTSRFAELRDFYGNTLGLAEVGAFHGRNIIFLKVGGTTIELIEADPEAKVGAFAHFAFEVADVDAAVVELKAKGVVFHVEPTEVAGEERTIKLAFFRDPDGNELELVEPLGSRYPAGTAKADLA